MAKKGQLSKFKPEFCQKIVDYFRIEQPYREHKDKNGKIQLIPTVFPCIEDFADSIGVVDETLVNWTKDKFNKGLLDGANATFFTAYTRAKALQKAQLIKGAQSGAYNNNFSIFLAKNAMGMSDEVTIHTPDSTNMVEIKKDIAKMSNDAVDQALQDKIFSQGNTKKSKK